MRTDRVRHQPARKCYIMGSSHANKLYAQMQKIPHILETFEIINFSVKGATYDRIQYPNENHLQPDDVIILWAYGNDLMEKHVYREGSKFHLRKFCPHSFSYLENAWEEAYRYFSTVPCQVFVIDMVKRFVNCCPLHIYPGIDEFQRKANVHLKTFFETLSTVKVLNHMSLLPYGRRKLQRTFFYNHQCIVDNVHLKSALYFRVAQTIWQKHITHE